MQLKKGAQSAHVNFAANTLMTCIIHCMKKSVILCNAISCVPVLGTQVSKSQIWLAFVSIITYL